MRGCVRLPGSELAPRAPVFLHLFVFFVEIFVIIITLAILATIEPRDKLIQVSVGGLVLLQCRRPAVVPDEPSHALRHSPTRAKHFQYQYHTPLRARERPNYWSQHSPTPMPAIAHPQQQHFIIPYQPGPPTPPPPHQLREPRAAALTHAC